MTRLILAAGVAALAITAPASAKPDRGGGDREQRAQAVKQQGGGERAQRADRAQPVQRAERTQRSQRFAAFQERRERRVERVKPERAERVQNRSFERQQVRANRVDQVRNRALERQQGRSNQLERIQNRGVERQEARANRIERIENRGLDRQLRAERIARFESPVMTRENVRVERLDGIRSFSELPRFANARGRGLIDGCPPGLWVKNNGCLPPGQAKRFLGQPISAVSRIAALSTLPVGVRGFYPDTDDYYYRYGDGYLYRIDRDDELIASVLPLFAGGFLPGQYLPNNYMSSFVPSYYGFNSFYPDYGNDCYRYGNGVVYEVDCFTGFVEDVIPLYAGGYGVGQFLPTAYSTYNVPLQYRSMYFDTPDYGYWYAPGAIYQYDRDTSLISSVAALLSPGFSVGQPLPLGYNAYNVPYDYRATYYDTPNAWYRYNNGNIYQVDPTTMLVTAIVASILT